jgi:hypothetical protein
MQEPTKKQLRNKKSIERNKEINLNKVYDPEELLCCTKCKRNLSRKHYYVKMETKKGCESSCIDCQWTRKLISHINSNNKTSKKDKRLLITKEEVDSLTRKPCKYCQKYQDPVFKRNGIDRINSNKPYTLDNVAPSCTFCNDAKKDHPREEFLLKIGDIYDANRLEIEHLREQLKLL